ncbi:FAD-binding monooxygenase [soil metagenome]
MSTPPGSTHAIVIGASMAGLATARVLSDHVDQVTILERDHLPEEPANRRGVPQGRHAHVLLVAGQDLLEDWFPGLRDELVAAGAVRYETQDVVWHQAGAPRVRADIGAGATSMSRPLLEATVRTRLLRQCPNVTVVEGVTVERPLVEDGRVVGVIAGGEIQAADLVVDCSGRTTRNLDKLAEAGYPEPEISAIAIDMAYRTRFISRTAGDLEGGLAVLIEDPTSGHRMGTIVPAENDQWIITLGSFHGDTAPTDAVGFEEFTRSLPSPEIADVLSRSQTISPVLTYRMPTSQRRHMERLDRTPPGFVVLGDALCSFNPIYAQGMSSAALQAKALGASISKHGLTSPKLSGAFYRRAAAVVHTPWKIAAGGDFADPRTTGPKPAGTNLTNRYLDQVFLACHTSAKVSRQTMRVQNLLARPETLLTPWMAFRVLIAARRSPVGRTGSPTTDVTTDPATNEPATTEPATTGAHRQEATGVTR